MSATNFRTELQRAADRLRDPLRMRLAVSAAAVLLAYFGIYSPLAEQIKLADRRANEARQQVQLAKDVEFLRAQSAQVVPRLAPSPDPNEVVQYVLDGIRALPLKLLRLDSDSTIKVGPYDALALKLQVQGDYQQLDALLAWIESNERLFRIESVKLAPPRGAVTQPALAVTVLALKVRR